MKIIHIGIYPFNIPLRDVFQISTMALETAENVVIEIGTDEGITGWGEASPMRSIVGETQSIITAASGELKPLLMGKDPLAIADLVHMMDAYLPYNTTAKSAFDMALYDIAAQAAGVPLYRLLGGAKREMETDLTIGIGDPDQAGKRAAAIRDMGFRIIKVKIGMDFAADYRRLANIRDAIGDEPVIRVDANQGWNRVDGVANLCAIDEFDIEFCEQPCAKYDLETMKYISDRSPIPVMADEALFTPHDAYNIARLEAAPYLNIKLSKSGGIANAARIAAIADAAGMPCMMGCMSESRIGITAAAHFALSQGCVQFFDLDSHLEHSLNPVIGGVTTENGMIDVPDAPGLGARPDPAFLKIMGEVG